MPFATDTYIRRAEREDLDAVVSWMQEPDFQRFLYGDPARSPRQIREQIAAILGRSAGLTLPGGVYLMIDSKADGLIGMISLQNISWRNRSCSLDLYLAKLSLRSRSVAGIAAYRAFEYCFDELNLHRVSSVIYAFNSPSWRMLEGFGGVRELVMRRHVMRDGVYHDAYAYGFLRRDFDAMRERHARQVEGINLEAMIAAVTREDGDAIPS